MKSELLTLTNVGKATLEDLTRLNIHSIAELARANPDELYIRVQAITQQQHDLCVWDVFAAIIHEAKTGIKQPWWEWTKIRKERQKKGIFLNSKIITDSMNDVVIGKGNLAGKGVYANRDFKKEEIVIQYHLKQLTEKQYDQLPEAEKMFTHSHWGVIQLYFEPERYVNHSDTPNTYHAYQDLIHQADVALRDIKKGEMITGDASKDDI